MPRITIKGGVWKNTEDEILKVAVMKYGKNQWSRISSLLVRKSAAQCKARWYEWLDPSIKKTEWSHEEEERLLHLAKIMPCQWRSIAPMIGRTAAQCLEKYEQLLDAAQQPEEAVAAAATGRRTDDPRMLRPGEIDPLPEAKPARPDPQDMDEDEKEMLSEARARLSNTKGKKAKRKARERALEEARRLAVLQKQRELKAAGIELKKPHKRKMGIDYMEEIPLERRAPAGFYSTAEDDALAASLKSDRGFKPVDLEELEGKSKLQVEMEERKKDAKKLKLFKATNLPDALLKINQLNDPQQISRRIDMNLPAPQIQEEELAEIAKLGAASGLTHATAGGQTPLRTPMTSMRTPLRPDTILTESQNLIALTKQQSSLLGGENTPLVNSDFSGIKPKSSAIATPNPLATPLHQPHTPASGATPMRKSGIAATPLRDGVLAPSAGLTAEDAVKLGRSRAGARRSVKRLRNELAALPQPANEFSLVLPDLPDEDGETSERKDGMSRMEEDAEDVELRAHVAKKAAREAAWSQESQVIQRGLPRPLVINPPALPAGSSESERAAADEMMLLMRYDQAKYPLANAQRKRPPPMAPLTAQELASARSLIEAEVKSTSPHGRMLSDEELQSLSHALDDSEWSSILSDHIFLPSQRSFGLISRHSSTPQLLAAYQQHFSLLRTAIQALIKRSAKFENNLQVTLGGYQQINSKLRSEVAEAHARLQDAIRSHQCFTRLHDNEQHAMATRKYDMQMLYAQQQEKERELQKKFQALSRQVEELNTMQS